MHKAEKVFVIIRFFAVFFFYQLLFYPHSVPAFLTEVIKYLKKYTEYCTIFLRANIIR